MSWISVKDKKPLGSGWYVVWLQLGIYQSPEIAWWWDTQEEWQIGEEILPWDEPNNIVYWQELEEPNN